MDDIFEEDEDINQHDRFEKPVIWEKRAILLSAFGLVGFGALVGALSVYIRYIKLRIEKKIAVNSIAGPYRRPNTLKDLKSETSVKLIDKEAGDYFYTPQSEAQTTPEYRSSHVQDAATSTSVQTEDTATNTKPRISLGTDEDNLESYLTHIDVLLDGTSAEQHEAYGKLKSTGDKLKNVCDYWWRMARATHIEALMAEERQDKESQKSLLISAVSHAEKALKLDDNSSDAHKWFAITSGSRGDFLKINERIQSGYIFKEHIDRALELNPSDSSLHHLLGRFCFEVSQLSWMERRVAATLFSTPPSATVQEALHHFLEADRQGKPFVENQLFIAKCYISTGDTHKAALWLHSGSQLTARNATDKKAQVTVHELLGKYRKYL